MDLYTGWKNTYLIDNADVSFEADGQWIRPEQGKVRGNQLTVFRIELPQPLNRISKVRVEYSNPKLKAVREIAVYEALGVAAASDVKIDEDVPTIQRDIHQIGLNQAR